MSLFSVSAPKYEFLLFKNINIANIFNEIFQREHNYKRKAVVGKTFKMKIEKQSNFRSMPRCPPIVDINVKYKGVTANSNLVPYYPKWMKGPLLRHYPEEINSVDVWGTMTLVRVICSWSHVLRWDQVLDWWATVFWFDWQIWLTNGLNDLFKRILFRIVQRKDINETSKWLICGWLGKWVCHLAWYCDIFENDYLIDNMFANVMGSNRDVLCELCVIIVWCALYCSWTIHFDCCRRDDWIFD